MEIHGIDLIILKCYSFSSREVNMIIFLHQAITWPNVDLISNHVLWLLSNGNFRRKVADIIKWLKMLHIIDFSHIFQGPIYIYITKCSSDGILPQSPVPSQNWRQLVSTCGPSYVFSPVTQTAGRWGAPSWHLPEQQWPATNMKNMEQ